MAKSQSGRQEVVAKWRVSSVEGVLSANLDVDELGAQGSWMLLENVPVWALSGLSKS